MLVHRIAFHVQAQMIVKFVLLTMLGSKVHHLVCKFLIAQILISVLQLGIIYLLLILLILNLSTCLNCSTVGCSACSDSTKCT